MGTYAWNITLFQDFARKIPRPALPTGRPGRAQSGRTPEFGYKTKYEKQNVSVVYDSQKGFYFFKAYLGKLISAK